MSTTWSKTANQTPATYISNLGAASGVYTFHTPTVAPAYTTSYTNFTGTWESLQSVWQSISGVWGSL